MSKTPLKTLANDLGSKPGIKDRILTVFEAVAGHRGQIVQSNPQQKDATNDLASMGRPKRGQSRVYLTDYLTEYTLLTLSPQAQALPDAHVPGRPPLIEDDFPNDLLLKASAPSYHDFGELARWRYV